MRRLRHPVRAVREPFGKAGLIVAILALLLAMGGAAFAAGGLSGKEKREVQKIAKRVAGKPGVQGPAGPTGKSGSSGAIGAEGTNGVGVTTTAASKGECAAGGIKVTSASGNSKVCNGTTGFTETLPSGQTETGVFSTGFQTEAEYTYFAALDFPIPLAAPLEEGHTFFVTSEEEEGATAPAGCPGSVEEPSAEPGDLCIYQGSTHVEEAEPEPGVFEPGAFHLQSVISPSQPPVNGESKTGVSGAVALFHYGEAAGRTWLQGSWALTAP